MITSVSIHAPWEGCDYLGREVTATCGVSIHAPWEGCDVPCLVRELNPGEFQFTHPGKGATPEYRQAMSNLVVSIHAPWEGCDAIQEGRPTPLRVSIHAPWEGCDQICTGVSSNLAKFQFTHPGKGATLGKVVAAGTCAFVSIHAPWEGCDVSTRSIRAAFAIVSIHAPWEGCDCESKITLQNVCGFNSRTLGRVRLLGYAPRYAEYSFNSRTLGRVRLSHSLFKLREKTSFNSRTLGRVRPASRLFN